MSQKVGILLTVLHYEQHAKGDKILAICYSTEDLDMRTYPLDICILSCAYLIDARRRVVNLTHGEAKDPIFFYHGGNEKRNPKKEYLVSNGQH